MAKFDLQAIEPSPTNNSRVLTHHVPARMLLSAEQLVKYRITSKSRVAKPQPSLYIGNSVVAVKGDLAIISGPAKAGKSAICLNMLASALLPDDSNIDTLSIHVPYAEGRPVIYIDTEQGDYAVASMLSKLCDILSVTHEPDNLHMLSLREETKEQAYAIIMSYLETYDNPQLVIIDGIGDLVGSANDESEGIRILRDFMVQASKLKTTIVTVLHDSHANSSKPRGHLGSEAERKAGGLIAVTMDNGCRYIVARKLRHGANFDPVPFMWCDISKRFVSMEPSSVPVKLYADNATRKKEEARQLAPRCFLPTIYAVRSKEILEDIKRLQSCGESAAYSRLKEMEAFGFIISRREGKGIHYTLDPALRPPPDPQTILPLS